MLGSRIEERKDRQTGIGIGEQIQIITEIPPFTGRIPTDITVGLRERAEAVAIKDALLPAITGMMKDTGTVLSSRSIIMKAQTKEPSPRLPASIGTKHILIG